LEYKAANKKRTRSGESMVILRVILENGTESPFSGSEKPFKKMESQKRAKFKSYI